MESQKKKKQWESGVQHVEKILDDDFTKAQ
jgi:hypothetical protein